MEDPTAIEQLQHGASLGVMAERLRNFDITVNRFEKRLFGNGTPGELDKLDARITAAERMVWKIQGIGVILVILIEAVSRFLLK